MMKKINIQVLAISAMFFAFTSCDEETNDYLPETTPVLDIAISAIQPAGRQCAVNFELTVQDEGTLHYVLLSPSMATPDSDAVFASGTTIAVEDAGTSIIGLDNLIEGEELVIYAISVNKDGLRSSEVFSANYTQPSYEQVIGETYNASVSSPEGPSYTATLTPVNGSSTEFLVDSAWGPNYVAALTGDPSFEGAFTYPATLSIASDNTVTIFGDPAEFYATGGTGAYDPCTNIISYTLTQALFTTAFTVDVQLSLP